MRKALALLLAAILLLSCAMAGAEETLPAIPDGPVNQDDTPPEPPGGDGIGGMGTPPDLPEGGMAQPPEKPNGDMPGGMMGAPQEYAAVYTITEDTTLTGVLASTDTDENLLHVVSGTATVTDATMMRTSADSTGGDASSFYGVGAAVLTTGGTAVIENSTITTDAAGGAGVFAYGDGVAYVSDTTITTPQDTSGGIHVAGGGTLYAKNLTVTTEGESSAAIRSDRGSGTMVVDGGTYTANGVGSPAVYVTADISIHAAVLNATGSEALCMEGLNTVRLFDCDLSGAMQDLSVNDHTWTVIVYQSMSGDAAVGKGHFEMSGGSLTSLNGGLFYTTNTESEFILRDVTITACEDSEYFLRVTGNANQRGWGTAGQNGAQCIFTGLEQFMEGDVLWDSISTLDMYVAEGSTLVGAVVNDETYAGDGGDGYCNLTLDASSAWIVTGDSRLTSLACEGSITDQEGNAVTIVSASGEVLAAGGSPYTITVDTYTDICDLTGMGSASDWDDDAMAF